MSPAACLEHSARSLETERLEQRHNVRDLRHMHCQGGDGDAQLLDFLDDVLQCKRHQLAPDAALPVGLQHQHALHDHTL